MPNERLVTFMRKIMTNYDKIRGKYTNVLEEPYWDVVVLTTADDDQKLVYMLQIRQKMARKELPLGLPIHVVADPPGPKLGNGGSTLTAVSFLQETYQDKLDSMRVLLIHAGGQSQRMPSASTLGKIFSPVPLGNPIYQMLDVKLATFMPLIPKMCPGVFVTCADDFLIYNLESDFENVSFKFASTGFTALAHPSTLSVGTGHGVYVIKNMENVDPHMPVQQCECTEVLQKANEVTMYEKGAVLKSENLSFSDGIQVYGRAVYTDSSFFFSHDVTKRFLHFIQEHGPVECEIDAYGDFLQALGERATSQYIHNTANVSTVTPNLIETREAIFNLLNDKPLTLLLMNSSKFIHIGTTKEYIQHFCCDHTFQQEMGLSKDVFNLWFSSTDSSGRSQSQESGDAAVPSQFHGCSQFSDISQGCVMHSVLPKESIVAHTAVVEYCRFTVPVNIGQNVIISSCEYDSTVKAESSGTCNFVTNPGMITVPNDIFLHTIQVALLDDTVVQYVTVFFDIKDNLKKEANSRDVGPLAFLGRTVEDYTVVLDIDPKIVEKGTLKSKVNLWFANLFPVSASMTESLTLALGCIDAVKKDSTGVVCLKEKQLISMATILRKSKVLSMLDHRCKMFSEIVDNFQ